MKTTDTINHEAIVREISPKGAIIQLLQAEGCQSCSAKGVCGVSESDKKLFIVQDQNFAPGQKVCIEISTHTASRALFAAYLLPFLLIVMTLLVMQALGFREAVAGLTSLAVLPVYFYGINRWLNTRTEVFRLNISRNE